MNFSTHSSKIIAVAIAVITVLWVASGIFASAPSERAVPEKQAQTSAPLMDVRVREMRAQPFADRVIVTGRSRAVRSVEMKAETSGQVTAILKEEGDKIAQNDVLATLELKDREARVREARQRVNQRTIEYNAARKLENKGFNSRVRLSQSEADLEDAKARLVEAEVDLAKTKITAPFDGVLTRQAIEEGNYLAIGGALFTIVDLDPIEFAGFVSERRIGDIAPGKSVQMEFLDGRTIAGTVTYVSSAADPQTRTFEVVVSAPNENLAIKEGLTAKIAIPAAEKQAFKISPSILSLNDAGEIGVKIVDQDNKVGFIPVTILADEPQGMWIAGPPDVARIITVGQDFVVEGQTVNPVVSTDEGLL